MLARYKGISAGAHSIDEGIAIGTSGQGPGQESDPKVGG